MFERNISLGARTAEELSSINKWVLDKILDFLLNCFPYPAAAAVIHLHFTINPNSDVGTAREPFGIK